ncbi:dihydrolipoyl dehydrogenase [Marinihelvus fidelis]|uniref:Dihydrolipoyl dehydrogenase n=1 Tax=Marinihelvus fidelis TaxID=2613842 RepID=A0A5N0TCY1_9GAMM|nr:dihydrolipoyl dehydrogenase [Marinihelvus fidelis]KAA9132611.1 dihydrolipoyl dehydrogenase [Marinihelvus fidelis]
MDIREVDVAIIGAGTAGLNARREVEKAGKTPLMIESGAYGTTCARVGCMPSKLLIAAADAAHHVAGAGQFGIEVDGWQVDAGRVFERVRAERDRFVGFVVSDTEEIPAEQRLMGHAVFTGPTTLRVDDQVEVRAGAVVVAAGSAPFVPPPYDAIRDHVLVNDDIFELESLPQSLAVVGTGIIGLELGQAMQRLGTQVTFFSPFEDIGPFTDPEVRRVTRDVLGEELELAVGTEMLAAEPVDGGVRLHWRDSAGVEHERIYEKVLVAAGRRANYAGLGLENTGLALDQRGFPSWDPRTAQAGDAPIFFAGDVSGHRPLLHEASDEGRIAGANAARFPDVTAHVRRTAIAVAFTEPNMAMVGKAWSQLEPDSFAVGEVSFANQGRSRVMGINQGLLRVYADRETCTLVGAEMLGPRAEHLAHLLAWSIQQRLTVTQALQMPFYHPVIEEGLRTALRDLACKLRLTGACRGEDLATAPGN